MSVNNYKKSLTPSIIHINGIIKMEIIVIQKKNKTLLDILF